MLVTPHFTFAELIRSETAEKNKINNMPPDAVRPALNFTAAGLERIRSCLGEVPLHLNSVYRCLALNYAVGGSRNSQHMKGEAADFVCPQFGDPKHIALFLWTYMKVIGIDQLIMEGGWVHVSFTLNPRYEVLTLSNGTYLKGLV